MTLGPSTMAAWAVPIVCDRRPGQDREADVAGGEGDVVVSELFQQGT